MYLEEFLQCQKVLKIVFLSMQSNTNSLILYKDHSLPDSICFQEHFMKAKSANCCKGDMTVFPQYLFQSSIYNLISSKEWNTITMSCSCKIFFSSFFTYPLPPPLPPLKKKLSKIPLCTWTTLFGKSRPKTDRGAM